MFYLIKFLTIYLLIIKIFDINCDLNTEISANYSDYELDYDNQTDGKLFDLIEERDLLDAIRESDALLKKHRNGSKESLFKDRELTDETVDQLEKNLFEIKKNTTKEYKLGSNNGQVNPFILKITDKASIYTDPLMKRLLPMVYPLSDELYDSNISPLCLSALIRLGKGIKENQIWALKWLDSMGRIPSGIFDGTTFSFGEYEQCLNSQMPITPTSDLVIRGKYCMGGISSKELINKFAFDGSSNQDLDKTKDKFFGRKMVRLISREAFNNALSKTLKDSGAPDRLLDFSTILDFTYRGNGLPLAVCIPDTCSALEINEFINKTIYPKTGLPFGIAGGCQTLNDPIVLDTNQIVAVSTFSVLFVLVFISSFVDLLTKSKNYTKLRNNFSTKLLLCFSYQMNLEVLSSQPKKIRCIDGIRVLTSIWIFIAHSYLFNLLMAFTWKRPNSSFLTVFATDERYLLIRNAWLTETFFFVSAFLFTFIMYPKVVQMKGRVDYFLLMAIRWMRFVPPLIASIFILYLAPLLGSGPIFKSAYESMSYPCYKNWYKNILFVNNLWLETVDEMCNGPSWYLSAEFQLFLFAPIFLIFLYRKPKLTMYGLASLTILGCFTTLMPMLWGKRPATNLVDSWMDEPEQLYDDLYYYLYPPYAHVSAYALGILIGYLMRKYPDQCQNLSKLKVTAIWIVCIGLGVFAFTFNKDWNKPGKEASDFEMLFYVATKSLVISGFTCGLVFNCANGYGGFVDKFLSWRVWVPLGRLSMGVYLYQMPVIFNRAYSVRYSVDMTDNWILTTVAFDCLVTFMISFVLYMLVEGPFGGITILLMTTPVKREKTLSDNFAQNIKIIESNVQINGYKINTELNDFNNNTSSCGADNPSFICEHKL